MQGNNPGRPAPDSVPIVPRVAVQPFRAANIPKMSLTHFCDHFGLSVYVLQKLDALRITGPHGLRFVSDQQLVEKGELEIGELADVQDAQEWWMLGQGQDS